MLCVFIDGELLPPANVVCEGYVFTGVCLSTGGWVGIPACLAGHMTRQQYISRCTVDVSQLVWRQHTGNIKCMMGYVTWYTPHPPDGESPTPQMETPLDGEPPRWRTPPDGEPPWMENPPDGEHLLDGEPPLDGEPALDGEPPRMENPPSWMENPPWLDRETPPAG